VDSAFDGLRYPVRADIRKPKDRDVLVARSTRSVFTFSESGAVPEQAAAEDVARVFAAVVKRTGLGPHPPIA
jgi:hypothetical protein